MFIYFIQEEPDGAVKIGKTSNLVQRLAALQNACSKQLKVLYSFEVPEDKADYAEKHIHQCFRNRRMRGEWFSPCPYMYDYIKTIEEKGFFITWQEGLEDEIKTYKFNDLYNKTFHYIEESLHYGDIRRIEALAFDLEELLKYAKRGCFSK